MDEKLEQLKAELRKVRRFKPVGMENYEQLLLRSTNRKTGRTYKEILEDINKRIKELGL